MGEVGKTSFCNELIDGYGSEREEHPEKVNQQIMDQVKAQQNAQYIFF